MKALGVGVTAVVTVEVVVTVVVGVARVVVTAVTPLQEQADESLAAGASVPLAVQAVVASAARLVGELVVKTQDACCRTSRAAAVGAAMASLFIGKLLTVEVVVTVAVSVTVEVQGVTVTDMKDEHSASLEG